MLNVWLKCLALICGLPLEASVMSPALNEPFEIRWKSFIEIVMVCSYAFKILVVYTLGGQKDYTCMNDPDAISMSWGNSGATLARLATSSL